ncbi:MAG: ABC transporter substrate-binding protein [Proteobacteria bacterium]|nr:ABC transporter substrate-binding protein [Pseudomonadota bacterium]
MAVKSFSGTCDHLKFQHLFNKLAQAVACLLLCFFSSATYANPGQKVLYINSYHPGYAWSDGIAHGIESRFLVEDLWYKTHYMGTKHNRSKEKIKEAAREAKKLIERMSPDVVIISDDDAAKYLLAPYYKNASLPFVYCGINWDSSVYGLPYENTTGMLEINLVRSLVDLLSSNATGKKLGFLSVDDLSGHRMQEYYQDTLGRPLDQAYFVNSIEEWEAKFLDLQEEVDMMILESPAGIDGWTRDRALPFVMRNADIPIGSAFEWLAPFSLVSIAKIPQEQGWWAAEQAIKILKGTAPASIPEARNVQGKLFANLNMANQLGITLSAEILQTAILITE